VRVPGGVIADVTGQRQDLESCQDQAAGEEDVLTPEASHDASASHAGSESDERADMRDGADWGGEGWEGEDGQIETRGVRERVVGRPTRVSEDGERRRWQDSRISG
jgi:hypothetical protein